VREKKLTATKEKEKREAIDEVFACAPTFVTKIVCLHSHVEKRKREREREEIEE